MQLDKLTFNLRTLKMASNNNDDNIKTIHNSILDASALNETNSNMTQATERPSTTISAVHPIHTLYIAPKVDPDRYQVDIPDLLKLLPTNNDDSGIEKYA